MVSHHSFGNRLSYSDPFVSADARAEPISVLAEISLGSYALSVQRESVQSIRGSNRHILLAVNHISHRPVAGVAVKPACHKILPLVGSKAMKLFPLLVNNSLPAVDNIATTPLPLGQS